MKRAEPLTKELKAMFIRVLAQKGGNVTATCRDLMVSIASAKRAKDEDPEFSIGWYEAIEIGNIMLEDEARRRAMDGIDKPIYFKGRRIDTIREYSDALLKFILSKRKKDIFGDKLTLEGGEKPIVHEHGLTPMVQAKFDEMFK